LVLAEEVADGVDGCFMPAHQLFKFLFAVFH
jgi:hypothetical protein